MSAGRYWLMCCVAAAIYGLTSDGASLERTLAMPYYAGVTILLLKLWNVKL